MLHLPAERLAALADEHPTAAETAHLAACATCCGEREAHARLRRLAASDWARITPPTSSWPAIADRLRGEGLVAPERRPAWRRGAARWSARAAAALLLLGGGAVLGRYSAAALPGGDAVTVADAAVGGARNIAAVDSAPPTFESTADALAALARAERQYQLAAAFLVEQDPSSQPAGDSSSAFRSRLAALDEVMAATRVALYEAPHDPIINRYYLATMGAREATLRQLGTALPVGTRINRY